MPTSRALSNADTALLALLCESAMHPWQIEKTVKDRDMRFWTDLSQSTIYKQLRALEKAGLVEVRQEVEEGRLRKVYSVTRSGRASLRVKLEELLAEPEHLKWRLDLATSNIDLLPREKALSCLRVYRKKLEENIEGYGKLDAYLAGEHCPAHRHALARRPIRIMEGEVRWLDEFISEMEEKP